LHATFLLRNSIPWQDAKTALELIGYSGKQLLECESWLKDKELIRWAGQRPDREEWITEEDVVRGHWALLHERSYTDNAAVACSIEWRSPDGPAMTDPLDHGTVVQRCMGSLWFLREVWKAERAVAKYPRDPLGQRRCGSFDQFAANRAQLGLPSVTNFVAKEYVVRVRRLETYPGPKEAIDADRRRWEETMKGLEQLVAESGSPDALLPSKEQ
jgi:hypothetical protein